MTVSREATKKYVLIIVTVVSLLNPMTVSPVNVALPAIGKEFSMDAILLSWVATSSLMASAVFVVPFGRIADIYGRKKVFTYGLVVSTLASVLCALSTSGLMLISMRVLTGLSASMIMGTGFAIITSVFPAGERGRALGITVASTSVGISAGPFVGGLLTEHLGWRYVFVLAVPLALVPLMLTLWKLKGDWAASTTRKIDIPGSLIYGITLVAIIYGFSRLPALTGVWIILVGIVALVAFVRWETRVGSPILDMDLFRRNRAFAFSILAALLHYSAAFAVTFLLSLYLQYIKGFSPQSAGLVLVSTPVVQAVCSPIAGRLSDRIQPRFLASGGMALVTTALALFVLLREDTALVFIIFVLVLLGFGVAAFASPNLNAIMSSVSDKHYGVASATQAAVRRIGMTFSMGIAMLLFAVYIGRVEITPEYYDFFLTSVRVSFIVFACLCFGGVFASLARAKVH